MLSVLVNIVECLWSNSCTFQVSSSMHHYQPLIQMSLIMLICCITFWLVSFYVYACSPVTGCWFRMNASSLYCLVVSESVLVYWPKHLAFASFLFPFFPRQMPAEMLGLSYLFAMKFEVEHMQSHREVKPRGWVAGIGLKWINFWQ